MTRSPPPARIDAGEEITRLIATLRETEERLEELTHGEIDTVADHEGRTFVLRRAQDQLRRSEASKHAAVLDALPANIAMLNSEGVIVSVNETWRRFASANAMADPAQGVGASYLAVCDHATGEDSLEARQVAAGIRAVLGHKSGTFSIEYPCHSPAERRWFLLTVSRLSDSESGGAVVMHIDVTKRHEAEEVALESEERFSGAFEYAPIGVALVSPDGREWLRVNRALCELFGYSEEEMFTLTVQDLTHPDDIETSLENVLRAIAGGTRSFQLEKRYVHKSGRIIDALLSISLVRDGQGKPLYFVSHVLDITARKAAEDALRASNRRFHQLADNITDAFFIRSPDMREVLYISPAFERIWGRPVESLYGHPLAWPSYIVPEDRERVLSSFSALTGDTAALDLEYRIARPDGEVRWVHARGFQVRDDAGTLISIIGILSDITESHRAAEELRKSEEEQRALAAQLEDERSRLVAAQQVAKVGSWETALTTMSVQWSDETHRIYETEPLEPMTHQKFMALVHPDDRTKVEEAFAESFDHDGSRSIEHRVLLPDGRIKFVEERWQLVFDAMSKPVRALGTCQDITERKQAEIALRESQRRLRDLIDGLGPSVFVGLLTPEGILIEINRSPLEVAGLEPWDVIGKHFADTPWFAHDPDVQRQVREAIARAVRGEASRFDMRVRGGGSKMIDTDFSMHPLRDESGRVTFIVPSAIVITERKQAEAALRRAQKLEAVGQLAAGVAHEFNNILQTLMSMAAITRMRGLSPEIVRIAGEMEVQIRRGASVTQQLLLASRHQELTKTTLDLREQIANAHALLRRLIPENITVVVETSSVPAPVEGDAGQIQQVILNLAINARDAMPDGGTLTLRVTSSDTEVSLDVEDDGAGFDETAREHIFEPFFTTKEVGKGTGLGLAVVYGIVEQHGGRIDVRSNPGEGTLFRVILPRTAHEPLLAEPVPEPGIAEATGRILLVEDDESVRDGIALLLNMIGYEVTAVGRGEEALALPSTPIPDLLLTDVSLPGIGGPALAKSLRERWPSLKITLMTGYADARTREVSLEQGWEILQKPFEVDDLARHLANVLNETTSGASDER